MPLAVQSVPRARGEPRGVLVQLATAATAALLALSFPLSFSFVSVSAPPAALLFFRGTVEVDS